MFWVCEPLPCDEAMSISLMFLFLHSDLNLFYKDKSLHILTLKTLKLLLFHIWNTLQTQSVKYIKSLVDVFRVG